MPLVRQLVTRMFGRFPNIEMNPDEVVAAGAAVMAGLKIKDQALDEVVMTDVCPYTLGVEVTRTLPSGQRVDGHFLRSSNATASCRSAARKPTRPWTTTSPKWS